MPEHEAVGVDQQDVGGYRGPQRLGEPGVVLPGDRGQQCVPDPLTGGARDPQQLLGLLRQPPDPRHQQVPQRLRQAGTHLALADQRLHEQRVALGTAEHRIEHILTGLAADEAGHEFPGVLAG